MQDLRQYIIGKIAADIIYSPPLTRGLSVYYETLCETAYKGNGLAMEGFCDATHQHYNDLLNKLPPPPVSNEKPRSVG